LWLRKQRNKKASLKARRTRLKQCMSNGFRKNKKKQGIPIILKAKDYNISNNSNRKRKSLRHEALRRREKFKVRFSLLNMSFRVKNALIERNRA